MSSRLQEIRAELYETLPTREGCDYRIWLGLDHATIAAECGVIVVTRVRYHADRTFDPVEQGQLGGTLSVVIEALAVDREAVVDLVAWPLRRPDKVATAVHCVDTLGSWRVDATPFEAAPLKVFRHPEGWLRGGCSGVGRRGAQGGAAGAAAGR